MLLGRVSGTLIGSAIISIFDSIIKNGCFECIDYLVHEKNFWPPIFYKERKNQPFDNIPFRDCSQHIDWYFFIGATREYRSLLVFCALRMNKLNMAYYLLLNGCHMPQKMHLELLGEQINEWNDYVQKEYTKINDEFNINYDLTGLVASYLNIPKIALTKS
jgi:hypothetical protein